MFYGGPSSSVCIAADCGLDCPGSIPGGEENFASLDQPWGTPSLLQNGNRIFPRGKVRLGRAAHHSPTSNVAVMEE
jgi:hypothetical protein